MTPNRKILVVDDQEDLRLQVARILRKKNSENDTGSLIEQIRKRIKKDKAPSKTSKVNYQVDTVGQGKQAYDLIKESYGSHTPYALMFLDMRMPPGWDGLETAQRIRSIDKEIQIVIMTAYADYEQQEIAEKIGEPDKLLYIKKPFQTEEVRQLALAMTEKWNMNKREKERLLLTNRLMRENTFLARHRFESIEDTYLTILDVFISFLDAKSGIIADRKNPKVLSSSNVENEKKFLSRAMSFDQTEKKSEKHLLLPFNLEELDGFIYVEDIDLDFDYEQIKPYLDILYETSREVLINAFLLDSHEAEKQLATIGAITNMMTAKLNAAMEEIEACTERLKTMSSSNEQESLCETINSTADKILKLSHEIEKYSKSQDHGQELELKDYLLKQLIQDLLSKYKETSQIDFVEEIDPALNIHCNQAEFKQAIDNIVQNSIDALNTAGRNDMKLTITAEEDDGQIKLAISDNAGRMPDEIFDHLFEPMVKDAVDELGLGTTISRNIIELHKGSIDCERLDDGTRINITLPGGA
ncbi:MAG: hybrid sensor histidine kinase/response regulator [Lentisphaeria bacterium]|nr:hybrid sensor histidine kinase/response regulator [Lentisphaeria bacterium]NQZ68591.1 hybrid sensor histidine kinase/response regulator [Lentisphaeria bacterium]